MARHWKIAVFVLLVGVQAASAQGMGSLTDLCDRPLRIAVRDDAGPFARRIAQGERRQGPECGRLSQDSVDTAPELDLPDHAGFTIGLCRGFLREVQSACRSAGFADPVVELLPVAAHDRFAVLFGDAEGVDLLCGATTATVTLSALAPHSPYTFVTASSALLGSGYGDGGCRIGVIAGTTSNPAGPVDTHWSRLRGWERFTAAHRACVRPFGDVAPIDSSEVTPFTTYPEAIAALLGLGDVPQTGPQVPAPIAEQQRRNGRPDLLVADRHILEWYLDRPDTIAAALAAGQPEADPASVEPDGLSTPGGDAAASDPVDTQAIAAALGAVRMDRIALALEPYAVFGSPSRAETVAHFSRYVARLQASGQFQRYVQGCFGRQIDRSFEQILDIQSRIRLGTFPDTSPPLAPASLEAPQN